LKIYRSMRLDEICLALTVESRQVAYRAASHLTSLSESETMVGMEKLFNDEAMQMREYLN
jgi:hypothetical protein